MTTEPPIRVTSDTIARYRALYRLPTTVVVTPTMVRQHWDLEHAWAGRLLASGKDGREALFAKAYAELYSRLDWLKTVTATPDDTTTRRQHSWWTHLLPQATGLSILEIGAGAGGLISYLATLGHRCIGSDITAERAGTGFAGKDNLRWISADAISVSQVVPPMSCDVVISDQVVEHLHPEDLGAHLEAVHRMLASGGRYLLRVPHALAGPLDLSQVFALAEVQGMHLKEYRYSELVEAGTRAGFLVREAFFSWPWPLRSRWALFNGAVRGAWLLGYLGAIEALCARLPSRRWARRLFVLMTMSKNVCLILRKP